MIEPVGDPRLPVSWALGYAGRGIVVIPVKRFGGISHKMLGRDWSFDDAGSTDPNVIKEWWAEDPLANVGIVPGARSQILILDLDVKGTKDGVTAWKDWLGDRRLDGGEWYAHTPSGGWHIWFSLPEGLEVRRKGNWLHGVDALGAGGLAVVPPSAKRVIVQSPRPWEPSTEVLRTYEWHAEYPGDRPSLAPDWLLEDVTTRHPVSQRLDESGNPVQTSPLTHLPSLEEFKARGLGIGPEGSRNRDAFDLMRVLLKTRHSREECLEIMREVWSVTPERWSFPEHELEKAIRSAERYHQRYCDENRARYDEWVPEFVKEELRRRGMR